MKLLLATTNAITIINDKSMLKQHKQTDADLWNPASDICTDIDTDFRQSEAKQSAKKNRPSTTRCHLFASNLYLIINQARVASQIPSFEFP